MESNTDTVVEIPDVFAQNVRRSYRVSEDKVEKLLAIAAKPGVTYLKEVRDAGGHSFPRRYSIVAVRKWREPRREVRGRTESVEVTERQQIYTIAVPDLVRRQDDPRVAETQQIYGAALGIFSNILDAANIKNEKFSEVTPEDVESITNDFIESEKNETNG